MPQAFVSFHSFHLERMAKFYTNPPPLVYQSILVETGSRTKKRFVSDTSTPLSLTVEVSDPTCVEMLLGCKDISSSSSGGSSGKFLHDLVTLSVRRFDGSPIVTCIMTEAGPRMMPLRTPPSMFTCEIGHRKRNSVLVDVHVCRKHLPVSGGHSGAPFVICVVFAGLQMAAVSSAFLVMSKESLAQHRPRAPPIRRRLPSPRQPTPHAISDAAWAHMESCVTAYFAAATKPKPADAVQADAVQADAHADAAAVQAQADAVQAAAHADAVQADASDTCRDSDLFTSLPCVFCCMYDPCTCCM